MKIARNNKRDNVLAGIGLLIALPAIYFFTGSFLKYEMNLLTHSEIWVPPPVVMIGGLLLAIGINLIPLFRCRALETKGIQFYQRIQSRPGNAMILGIAVLFLALLFGYVLVENLARA